MHKEWYGEGEVTRNEVISGERRQPSSQFILPHNKGGFRFNGKPSQRRRKLYYDFLYWGGHSLFFRLFPILIYSITFVEDLSALRD